MKKIEIKDKIKDKIEVLGTVPFRMVINISELEKKPIYTVSDMKGINLIQIRRIPKKEWEKKKR
ncbi:MAG: hypothetical protein AB1420_15900 [Bacillota bacterium]